jgi:2-oxoisovalerate dehydrogenase E1 component alpha subunit
MAALEAAAKVGKSPVSDMFSDVYSQVPWHLQQQREQVLDTARRHPELCPPDMELR